ncbi:MAG: hypothetical protein ACP5KN_07120 [Armatimonadota bacterium]
MLGRIGLGLARLVLVWPVVVIAARAGAWAQQQLAPQTGSPYEGALLGSGVGLIVGLSLWLQGVLSGPGWRKAAPDAVLCLLTLLWVAAAGLTAARGSSPPDLGALCAAAIGAAAAVLLLGR